MDHPLVLDDWPPVPIRTGRLLLRPPEARDRESFLDLGSDATVNHHLGGGRDRAALDAELPEVPEVPVVVCTQTANDRSLALAARLGFTELARFEEFDAEQWFGVRMPG